MGYCKCYEKGREEHHGLRLEALSLEEDPKIMEDLDVKKRGSTQSWG